MQDKTNLAPPGGDLHTHNTNSRYASMFKKNPSNFAKDINFSKQNRAFSEPGREWCQRPLPSLAILERSRGNQTTKAKLSQWPSQRTHIPQGPSLFAGKRSVSHYSQLHTQCTCYKQVHPQYQWLTPIMPHVWHKNVQLKPNFAFKIIRYPWKKSTKPRFKRLK